MTSQDRGHTLLSRLRSVAWLVQKSLSLDFRFLLQHNLPVNTKLGFLAKKYAAIARHGVTRFKLGTDSTVLGGVRIFYDSAYGLAGYQRVLTSTQRLLDVPQLDNASTVVDVGANVGYFSLMAAQRFPDARIVAIEPIPSVFGCLQRNTSHCERVTVINCAIADRPGLLTMSFRPEMSAISSVTDTGDVTVDSRTLDEVVESLGLNSIDLLKIDTESYEAHVLRGGQRALSMTKYLLIEVTIEGNANYTVPGLFSLLAQDPLNFQLVAIRNFTDKAAGPIPISDCLFENLSRDS